MQPGRAYLFTKQKNPVLRACLLVQVVLVLLEQARWEKARQERTRGARGHHIHFQTEYQPGSIRDASQQENTRDAYQLGSIRDASQQESIPGAYQPGSIRDVSQWESTPDASQLKKVQIAYWQKIIRKARQPFQKQHPQSRRIPQAIPDHPKRRLRIR